jgi:PBP1b-binding outer membrane lipoprotein LpoB
VRYTLFALLLVGCSTAPKTEPVVSKVDVVENPEYEVYTEYIEQEVAIAGAGVLAVRDITPPSPAREVLTLTYNRLSGIREPSTSEVENMQKALKDEKTLQASKAVALKVEAESTKLYKRVEEVDAENKSLKRQIELVNSQKEADAKRAATQKTLDDITASCKWVGGFFMLMCAGMVFMGRYMTTLACGSIGMGCIMSPIFIPTVLMQTWFGYTIAGMLILGILYGAYFAFKHIDKKTPTSNLHDTQN